MTSISYNYNTEYTTKWKQYDIAINSTMKTCILLVNFKIGRLCVRFDGLMD